MQPILSRLRNAFSIELKQLAWFRLLLGLLIAWDLWGRFQLRHLIFGDPAATETVLQEGLLTESLSGQPWTIWNWSLLWIGQLLETFQQQMQVDTADGWGGWLHRWQQYFSGPDFAATFLLAGIVLALMFAAGLFTRLTNVLLWLVVVSVQVRMPLLTTGADTLARLFLFWMMWLPAGAVFSLDAWFFPRQGFWRKRIHQTQMQWQQQGKSCPADRFSISSFATAALLLQFALMYFFTGVAKWNSSWTSGTAIQDALSWHFITRPLADSLGSMTTVLTPITYLVLALELAMPVLVFCPGLFRWTRRPTAWFLIGMHLGIACLMTIGTFSAMSIAGWVLLFGSCLQRDAKPSSWWRDERDTSVRPMRVLADSPRPIATARDLVLAGLMGLVVWWNAAEVRWVRFPIALTPIVHHLALFQDFPMFASPPTENWRWEHRTVDGVDLRQGQVQLPSLKARPGWLPDSQAQFLWRQLHVNLIANRQSRPEFVGEIWQRLTKMERLAAGSSDSNSQLQLLDGRTGEVVSP